MRNSIFVEPQHFIDLFEYDAWANGLMIEALSANGAAVPERALDLMSHLLRSQAVWLGRIEDPGRTPPALWERDDPDACSQRREQNTGAWLKFLRGSAAGDLNREVTYATTKGETFTSSIRDILTHVVNHGSYHRAQIAQLIRSTGAAPPQTDYILYARSPRS